MAKKAHKVDQWRDDGSLQMKLDTIKAMYAHGYSLAQVADYLGVAPRTLDSWKSKKNKAYREEIAEALSVGHKDFYFGSVKKMLFDAITDDSLDLETRLSLAMRLDKQYAHRHLTPEDEDSVGGNGDDDKITFTLNIGGNVDEHDGSQDEDSDEEE